MSDSFAGRLTGTGRTRPAAALQRATGADRPIGAVPFARPLRTRAPSQTAVRPSVTMGGLAMTSLRVTRPRSSIDCNTAQAAMALTCQSLVRRNSEIGGAFLNNQVCCQSPTATRSLLRRSQLGSSQRLRHGWESGRASRKAPASDLASKRLLP